jgi:glucose-1-phosphate cytidylyltransferase
LKVVILCGGYGTRIRDVADDIPKPMIPIGPYPILWHIMKYYSSFGFNEFILCLGYKGNVIREFFLNYEAFTRDITLDLGNTSQRYFHNSHSERDWKVTLVDTGQKSMTGARIHKIKKYIDCEEFMLTYGDGVGNIDINELLTTHRRSGKILTVTGVRPPGRFGELNCKDGIAIEFNEKPQATAGLISGGYFVGSQRLFEYLSESENLVFEQEPMRKLVTDRQLAVYEHDGFWQPMDTSREYQMLNTVYEKGDAPWVRW